MSYQAWFQCINEQCRANYPLNSIIYRCKECGSLLEVQHDLKALASRDSKAWMKLFDERYKSTEWPYGSGVWGKKEWILPEINELNIVSLYEGGTNLFWAEKFGKILGLENLWIKLCGNSHSGSFKDLGMTALVSNVKQMISEGAPIKAVACASTGDTSAALAVYCAAAGIQSIVLLPKGKISIAQLIQPISNGALVLSLDTDFDGCMRVVQEITKDETIYLANSMNSLRIEGQKTVGIEIVQQFDWEVPDVIIIPGGNLGNVSALGSGLLMMRNLGLITKLPRLVVAQAERANPLYRSYLKNFETFEPIEAQKTLASAIQIGNPVSIQKAIRTLKQFNGIVVDATEQELADAAALGDTTGMLNCPHTGVALAALIKLIKAGKIDKSERVVVISTAHGLKFPDFKFRYHEGTLDFPSRYANKPIELPPRVDAVIEALREILHKKENPAPKEPSSQKNWKPATIGIHGLGRVPKAHFSVSTPIVQTSNYYFDNTTDVYDFMKAKSEGRVVREHEYGRYGNPTQQECERKLAAIEGAERALLFATGMSAVIMTLQAYMRPKGHIIFTNDCYRQTRDFATNLLAEFGIEVSLVEPTAEEIAKAIQPNTNIIFTESPTNPYLRVLDLPAIVKVAKQHGVMTIIDATIATPYNIKPLDMGIDIVIHSATKYLGGHNDLLAGAALGKHVLLNDLYRMQRMIGATPGPFTCFLLERGLKTFALRMEHHNRAGLAVSRMLESHPKIEKIWYPGLESHPDYHIAVSQMRGFGSMITFLLKGGDTETRKFIDSLELFLITPSLGGSESLVTQMSTMSFFDYPEEYRRSIGMVDNLVRIALGLEDIDDLLADLKQALDKI
ncbi:MAG: threonine synthase [Nitrospirae bacterium]|nr:threonine synthase [Nitrospirota bacterium]